MMTIAAGKYRGKAKEWGIGKAGTGTVQVAIRFDLLDVVSEQGVCDSINYYGALSEAAYPFTVKALRACGWQGCDLTELENNGGGLDAQEVQLVVELEDYNGETRAKVRWVNTLGGLAMKDTLEGDSLKAFATQMKGKILALDPSSAKKVAANGRAPLRRATAPVEEPPPPGDNDIPF